MEGESGSRMVSRAPVEQKDRLLGRQALGATVTLSETIAAGMRLEASAFGLDARRAIDTLRESGLRLVPVYGPGGISQEAHNAFRFKRIFVDSERGIPFLSSSDIISLRSVPDKFLSRKCTPRMEDLTIQLWDVLISRSGTIGNVGLAGRRLAGMALSEDVIRVRISDRDTAGFVSGYLRSRIGRSQLIGASYGSVVVHIEPRHLTRILIPDLDPALRSELGKMFADACEARDKANDLFDEADALLHKELSLPPLADFTDRAIGPKISTVRARLLNGRLEASFHDPVARAAQKWLEELSNGWSFLEDPRWVREIRPITKFRKRTYVQSGGIPLLSSKQLFQFDLVNLKRLAKGAHLKDLPEIALTPGMIAITRSGTIGRVQIIPLYMDGWAASEHATRLIPTDEISAGYLFAWLDSDYGHRLLKRNSYGSVILEIDRDMIASIPVPNATEEIRREISGLVLEANGLMDQAWHLERSGIERIEYLVESSAEADLPTTSDRTSAIPHQVPLVAQPETDFAEEDN